MHITISHFTEGARQAEGLTVIIDVFRAFSLECYLFAQNAKLILPVANIDTALYLKQKYPDCILIGERNEMKIQGFDFGNSPFQIKNIDFAGKTIVHTTSAGTQGIIHATKATEIITGSFVNAGAIVQYIKWKNPGKVTLVCMGYAAREFTEEDMLCAEYIAGELNNISLNFKDIKEKIRQTSGKRFFDPEKAAYNPVEDFDLCLDLNRFNFIIRAEKQSDGLIFNQKVEF
jgi:2-phosphosulfolactate phosphatase